MDVDLCFIYSLNMIVRFRFGSLTYHMQVRTTDASSPRKPINHAAHGVVEDRREKEAECRNAQHATENGHAKCPTHFGASSRRVDQGQHAENECKRCHEDWPQ